MSLLNVAATLPIGTKTPAKFNPTAYPPPPMHMEKILSTDDLAIATNMIQAVSVNVYYMMLSGHVTLAWQEANPQ